MLGEIIAYYVGRQAGEARQRRRRRPHRALTSEDVGVMRALTILFFVLGLLVVLIR